MRAFNRRIFEEEEENESDDEDSLNSFENMAADIEEVGFMLKETQMMINMMIRNQTCADQHDKNMTQHIIHVNDVLRRRFTVVCEKQAQIAQGV